MNTGTVGQVFMRVGLQLRAVCLFIHVFATFRHTRTLGPSTTSSLFGICVVHKHGRRVFYVSWGAQNPGTYITNLYIHAYNRTARTDGIDNFFKFFQSSVKQSLYAVKWFLSVNHRCRTLVDSTTDVLGLKSNHVFVMHNRCVTLTSVFPLEPEEFSYTRRTHLGERSIV